jgi:hypothetical protein
MPCSPRPIALRAARTSVIRRFRKSMLIVPHFLCLSGKATDILFSTLSHIYMVYITRYIPRLSYFPKVGLCVFHPVCLYLCCIPPPPSPSAFECLNLSLCNLVRHGTWPHSNGIRLKSLPSVFAPARIPPIVARRSVSPLYADRHRLFKHVPAATNTRNNRIIVGRVIVCAVLVLSK